MIKCNTRIIVKKEKDKNNRESNKELINNINNRGDFNLTLEEFIKYYNKKRPHSALDFLSPMEYYEKVYGNEASFSQMCWTSTVQKKLLINKYIILI